MLYIIFHFLFFVSFHFYCMLFYFPHFHFSFFVCVTKFILFVAVLLWAAHFSMYVRYGPHILTSSSYFPDSLGESHQSRGLSGDRRAGHWRYSESWGWRGRGWWCQGERGHRHDPQGAQQLLDPKCRHEDTARQARKCWVRWTSKFDLSCWHVFLIVRLGASFNMFCRSI